jgi:tetratricopeptide (TPR) repeat protein
VPIFERARAAERARDFQAAATLYDAVLQIAPNVAEVWTNKGLVLVELGRHREALAAFEKAQSLNPKLVTPHVFAGVELIHLGRPRESIPALQTALRLEPGHEKATYQLARAYMAIQTYDRAIQLLSTLKVEGAKFLIGLSYLNWGRTAAVELASGTSPYGFLIKADAAAVAGSPGEAASAYREAMARLTPAEQTEIPIDPKTFRLQPSRWNVGQHEASLKAAKLRLDKGRDAKALFQLFVSCRALARETLARAVEEYPNSARTHLILAQLAQEDVDPDRATAEFEKAASADPANPEVQLLYLRHLAAIRSENLLLHARDAARRFPNHVAIQCELGNVLLKTTNPGDALAVFQSAVRADAKLPEAHAGLADAHAALGNFDAAIAAMRVALPADSTGNYHYRIGRWYQQTGRTAEARAAFAETERIKATNLKRVQAAMSEPLNR